MPTGPTQVSPWPKAQRGDFSLNWLAQGKGQRCLLPVVLVSGLLDLWRDLTRYRDWRGSQKETIDGTNNGCERAIGWWVKERYRTMRGYKRSESAVNVSCLLAWCGNHLDTGGADLALLIA